MTYCQICGATDAPQWIQYVEPGKWICKGCYDTRTKLCHGALAATKVVGVLVGLKQIADTSISLGAIKDPCYCSDATPELQCIWCRILDAIPELKVDNAKPG